MRIPQQVRDELGLRINRMKTVKQKFYYKDGGMFLTSDEAGDDSAIKLIPGKQNKHHGRGKGTYKHKRDLVRKARRMNRQVSHR